MFKACQTSLVSKYIISLFFFITFVSLGNFQGNNLAFKDVMIVLYSQG